MRLRLPWRLFISYAAVIAVGATVAWVTVRLLAPAIFNHDMTRLGDGSPGPGAGGRGGPGYGLTVRSAFGSALTTALLVGILASVAVAALAAAFVASRLARPLTAVRAATRRIAAGQYQAAVPVPREPELAAPRCLPTSSGTRSPRPPRAGPSRWRPGRGDAWRR